MYKLILASQSPRRKELLKMIESEFEIKVSNCEEIITSSEPKQVTMELAEQKAMAAATELNRQKKNNAQEVSKIRIYGKNENDKDTFIDTTFMEKIEPIKVSINESTGQVQTMEIYRFLKSLILPL